MRPTPSAEEFETLVTLIRQRTGLTVSDTRTDDILSAISKLVDKHRLTGISALVGALRVDSTAGELWQQLVELVTVGETYFFRNEAQFRALRAEILPPLISRRRDSGNKYLRLWCAGCATGEEPYSLAILLRELLPDYRTWHITLLATDINAASLEQAKRGVYRAWSFRNETPDDVKDRWFCADGESYKIQQSIKDMVAFDTLNLISDDYPSLESGISHIDLILCRNVTIYFDVETTRQVVKRFHEALSNEGWLIVGHSEPAAAIYS